MARSAAPSSASKGAKAASTAAPEGDGFTFGHMFTKEQDGQLDDDYLVDKKMLGEGSYGQVSMATHRNSGAKRAVKCIAINKISDQTRFAMEIEVQQSLDHPHIVKLYEVYKDAKNVYLVMELCTGGELFDRIVAMCEQRGDGKAFTEVDASRCMQQIMGALFYLHSTTRYVHRDIKPENFLMQNNTDKAPIKVIDFGLAKKFKPGTSDLHTKAGTPYYVAPEVLKNTKAKGYSEKCDVWSCGVLTYIMLCGYPPFYGDTDQDILRMVRNGKYDYPKADWSRISSEAKDFINRMLVIQPEKRASAEDTLQHPWMRLTPQVQAKAGALAGDFTNNLRNFRSANKLKKICLTLIAKHMKEDEISELQQTFLALDVNRDGTLTAVEIKQGIEKQKLALPVDLDSVLANLDTDGSGVIDYTEFIAATLSVKQYTQESVLWTAFRVFDRDNSGSITRDEMMDVLNDMDEKTVDQMIKEVDVDKDGQISFDEWKAMMSRNNLTDQVVEKLGKDSNGK